MDWIKKHADSVSVIAAICVSMIWMNGKFTDIETRLVRIETILIIKGIVPAEMMAIQDKE